MGELLMLFLYCLPDIVKLFLSNLLQLSKHLQNNYFEFLAGNSCTSICCGQLLGECWVALVVSCFPDSL